MKPSIFFLSFILSTQLAHAQPMNARVESIPLKGPELTQDQYHLKVSLEGLTEEDFEGLKTAFHTQALGAFDSKKTYALSEFLPSFVQKVLGKRIRETPYAIPASLLGTFEKLDHPMSLTEVEVSSNCHSVSWQWINFLQGNGRDQASFYGADGTDFTTRLSNFKSFNRAKARPGDVLVVTHPGGLGDANGVLHSAVLLTNGLVLEKTDWGSQYYYRIAYLDDVVAKYTKVDKKSRFDYYRVDNKFILPRYEEENSFASKVNYMANLEESDFDFSYLKTALAATPEDLAKTHLLVSEYYQEEFHFSFYPNLNTGNAGNLLSDK